MQIAFSSSPPKNAGTTLAALVYEDGLSAEAEALDKATGGAVSRAMGRRFRGACGTASALISPSGVAAEFILLIGAGSREALDKTACEHIGSHALTFAESHGAQSLAIQLLSLPPAKAARVAFGARLGSYRFTKYKTISKEDEAVPLKALHVSVSDASAAERSFAPLSAIAEGVFLARDLVSEPANVLHPEGFATRLAALRERGLSVEILGEAALEELGMGALLGVGQGSARESCLAVLQWRGDPDFAVPPVAFVGKGVTFDSGGVSIKPAEGLEEMKADMGGAAAIAGAMLALATRGAKVNAVGVLGIVENMLDGAAQRPGDIVSSMSGRTIEVINTDAEGRLVLADALWYCQDRFKPRAMIDVATLTGAVMIALGLDYGGMYCEDDALAEALDKAGRAENELLWRLPMPASYDRHIESSTADTRNLGVGIGRTGAASIAARFLKPFAGTAPWAHLDISGPAWPTRTPSPTRPAGATGYGVRLLHRFADASYEEQPT